MQKMNKRGLHKCAVIFNIHSLTFILSLPFFEFSSDLGREFMSVCGLPILKKFHFSTEDNDRTEGNACTRGLILSQADPDLQNTKKC